MPKFVFSWEEGGGGFASLDPPAGHCPCTPPGPRWPLTQLFGLSTPQALFSVPMSEQEFSFMRLLQAWMDQYFSRIKLYATNEELPSRIRFMLQDLIELRSNEVWLEHSLHKLPRPLEWANSICVFGKGASSKKNWEHIVAMTSISCDTNL